MLFLQNLTLSDMELAGIVGLIAAFALIFFFILLVVYLYLSFAYSAIGKRAKVKSPHLAWIPLIGPLIIAYKTSKMHWWPWLLIIGMVIPFINIFANIAFFIVSVVWHWKMFESVRRPGWFSILTLIPIVNFVIIGIAAWGKK